MAQTEAPPTEAPLSWHRCAPAQASPEWLIASLEARYRVTSEQRELTRRVIEHWHRALSK